MNYYQISKKASSEIGNHEGLLYLKDLCRNAKNFGCGLRGGDQVKHFIA